MKARGAFHRNSINPQFQVQVRVDAQQRARDNGPSKDEKSVLNELFTYTYNSAFQKRGLKEKWMQRAQREGLAIIRHAVQTRCEPDWTNIACQKCDASTNSHAAHHPFCLCGKPPAYVTAGQRALCRAIQRLLIVYEQDSKVGHSE